MESHINAEGADVQGHSAPVHKARIACLSSWNSKCGIAEYSRALLGSFDGTRCEWTILASCDDVLIKPDGANVVRCWTGITDRVGPLLVVLESHQFDVLVIQFHFTFLSLKQLRAVIACCQSIGTKVFVILHGTAGATEEPLAASSEAVADLATVDGILVHSARDIDVLRELGLSDNVSLLPLGHITVAPMTRAVARKARTAIAHAVETFERARATSTGKQFDLSRHEHGVLFDLEHAVAQRRLRLPDDALIIGSYGLLLPHKGIANLILATASLRLSGKSVKLLLTNAVLPSPISREYLACCQSLVAENGMARDVIFETDFLPDEISLARLAACDVLVFPFQNAIGSSSAAVRMGLASRRPVMCSPEPIFADVAEVVAFLDGDRPDDIASGICALLTDQNRLAQLSQCQEEWLARDSWSQVAEQLQDILEQSVAGESVMEQNHATKRFIADLVSEREVMEETVKALRDQFTWLAAQHEIAQRHATEAAQREQKLAVAKAELESSKAQLEGQNARLQEHNAWREQDLTRINSELTAALGQLSASRAKIDDLDLSARHWRILADNWQLELQSIRNSRSWWLTRPLRLASKLLRGRAP
jgi:glycosyltransferase involved in cell wall biosynthesis